MTQDKALTVLKSGANVFLTGEPGSGKSYTIGKFRDWLDEEDIPYAVTASTGIAATHIGGVTIHSWSGIGIKEKITDRDVENIIDNKPFIVKKIDSAKVLIIDEISMLNAETLDNINKVLCGVRGTIMTGEPFGGLQVVFVGDFFQLPPVVKNKEEVKFAFEADSWKQADLTYCYLHEQHRRSDPEFLEILTAIRQGEVTEAHKKILMNAFEGDPKTLHTKLFTHNLDVDRINSNELAKIESKEFVYMMTETGNPYLCSVMKKSCLSPDKLYLKKGAVVMFTRNKFDDDGDIIYVNGTLGEVIDFDDQDYPIVLTVDGREIMSEREEWSIEEYSYTGKVKAASIKQIPLKLAWAITVHKSQGMSLDHARVDLSKAFEYGQGYVAISRVRSMKGLLLDSVNVKAFEMHPKVVEADVEFRSGSDLANSKYEERI